MDVVTGLRSFGLGAQKARVPVALLGQRQTLGWPIVNSYFQEILGPRTSGSVLNVGAGRMSVLFRQAEMFAADEYHTLEMPGSELASTYQCYAENMEPVPDERYDWIVSTAVLEHAIDPWAVAREAVRVTKPGGFIYSLAPFSHQVHVGLTYGDYWRFTPQALEKLFPECRLREVEIWGDSPIMPNGYAVLMQKPPFDASTAVFHIWIDFPNEDPWRTLTPDARTAYDWPLYQVNMTPFELASELHGLREQIDVASNVFVSIHEITRASIPRYATRIGTLGFRGDRSFIKGL